MVYGCSRVSAALICAVLLSPFAHAADVDWKLYGGLPNDIWCFYDAKGVVARPDKNLRVWIKCLSGKEMDELDLNDSAGRQVVDFAARNMVKYYLPPITEVMQLDGNAIEDVIRFEATANFAHIQPTTTIFYELNCTERVLRELSVSINEKGGPRAYSERAGSWRHIPPEGNAAHLIKFLCPPR